MENKNELLVLTINSKFVKLYTNTIICFSIFIFRELVKFSSDKVEIFGRTQLSSWIARISSSSLELRPVECLYRWTIISFRNSSFLSLLKKITIEKFIDVHVLRALQNGFFGWDHCTLPVIFSLERTWSFQSQKKGL